MWFGFDGSPVRLSGSKAAIAIAIALGCLLTVAAGAPAEDLGTSGAPQQPPPLSAKRGDTAVFASLGTYDWNDPSSGVVKVVDSSYPLPTHKRLTVSPGDMVSLRIGAPAERVAVSLLRVGGNAPAGHAGGDVLAKLRSNPTPSRGRWVTKLPRDLKRGNVLDVFVEYADNRGTADFWVGLRSAETGAP